MFADSTSFACHEGDPPAPKDISENAIYVGDSGEFCQGGSPPNAITVSVTYKYRVFMPFVGAIIGQEIPLTATVTDTILEPRCPGS